MIILEELKKDFEKNCTYASFFITFIVVLDIILLVNNFYQKLDIVTFPIFSVISIVFGLLVYISIKLLRFKTITLFVWYSFVVLFIPTKIVYLLFENQESLFCNIISLFALSTLALIIRIEFLAPMLFMGLFFGISLYSCWFQNILVSNNLIVTLFSFILIIAYLAMLEFKKQRYFEMNSQYLKSLGGFIAHELRTPLATISLLANNFKKIHPSLLQVYKDCEVEGKIEKPLSQSKLHLIEISTETLEDISKSGLFLVDLMLNNIKNEHASFECKQLSISKCLNDALNRYPFNSQEQRNLINIKEIQDFSFLGNEHLFINVMYNLIKNALYSLEKAGKGSIEIWAEIGEKANKCYFKDTGVGIHKENLPHIFDKFFSDKEAGAGIGLSFCKHVISKFPGEIYCKSEHGYYTLFILTFPKLNTKQ